MVLVILLYVMFASTFTFGKAALSYIQPFMFIGIRMTIAGMLLLGYQYFFNRANWRYERKDAIALGKVAFFLIFTSFIAEFWAMQYVSAAKTCLLYNLSPFITALLAYWILSERLTRKQWLGLCIGILGFIPILMNQSSAESFTSHIWFLSMPELVLLIAVGSACYGWITTKHLVTNRGYSTIMVNGIGMLGGGILALLAGFLFEERPWILPAVTPSFGFTPTEYAVLAVLGYTTFLIIIANVVCFNLYSTLLRRYSTTFISFVGFTTPLFAALFDLLFFGEMVPISFFTTIGFVAIGIYIFYQDELKQQ